MAKFDISKLPIKKIVAIGAVIFAGISAVTDEINNQNKDKTIKNLLDRVSKLENKD